MKTFFLLLLLYTTPSWGQRSFWFANDDMLENFKDPDTIKLDATYTLYVRNVCKVAGTDDPFRNNCEEIDGKKTKIEMEYLLISLVHKRLLYLTTIPTKNSDTLYNHPLFAIDSFINIWYLNRFQIGVIDPGTSTVTFTDTRHSTIKTTWDCNFEKAGNIFSINSLTIGKKHGTEKIKTIKGALAQPMLMRFYKKQEYIIGLLKDTLQTDLTGYIPLPDNTFYWGKRGNDFAVIFKFNVFINDPKKKTRYKNLYYENKRIKYAPPNFGTGK